MFIGLLNDNYLLNGKNLIRLFDMHEVDSTLQFCGINLVFISVGIGQQSSGDQSSVAGIK